MIYTILCVMLLMRAASITWASGRGLGLGNINFFGPQMALAYPMPLHRAQKVFISRANPLTLASIKSILHWAV